MAFNNSINAPTPFSVANGGTGAQSFTANGILLGNGTGAITASAALTDGQLLIGSTGVAPVPATLTAGFGISITNGAGSITIASTGSFPVVEVTGTSQAMMINTAYIANNAGLVTLTLPATAAIGSKIEVIGKGAGLFRIAQNAGQVIHFGNVDSTTGAGGYVEATHRYDVVELACITADNEWSVRDAVGLFDIQ